MHGCRHRFKRMIMSILVLSMLLTVTGCGGASQTAGSRLNTQNAVDKVLNQKTGDGDVESKSSAGATTETTITTEMLYYCRLRDAEYQLIPEDDQ